MMALAASCLRGRSAVFAIRSFVRCHQRRVRRSRRLREVGRQRRRWLLASVFILARCGGSGVSGLRRHDEVRTVLQQSIARKPWSSWLKASPLSTVVWSSASIAARCASTWRQDEGGEIPTSSLSPHHVLQLLLAPRHDEQLVKKPCVGSDVLA